MNEPVAVYVHTPFCPSKCGYCDFNSFAMQGEIIPRTVEAICQEIERTPWRGRPAKTVFIGGGTPTFLNADQLAKILETVLKAHPPLGMIEVTSEANPGTVDLLKLKKMREAGFNRLSLGAQSFDTRDLVRLGRVHGVSEIGQALGNARQAGFSNVNLDLIFGLPGQSSRAWEKNLRLALSLQPEHLSLYGLTIEPGTRFFRYHQRGLLNLPKEEIHIEMFELARLHTQEHGLQQYEISNFARPGYECEHNLCYWRAEEYLGYGPGAVGCVQKGEGRVRYTNLKHPERYSFAIENQQELWCEQEMLDTKTLALEKLMLGLRLNKGLSHSGLKLDRTKLQLLEEEGLLLQEDDTVFLTDQGRLLHNHVVLDLMEG